MALFYEMELKIQTRTCDDGGAGLVAERRRALPLVSLHLLVEEHAGTCPFDAAQQDGTTHSQIRGWRKEIFL